MSALKATRPISAIKILDKQKRYTAAAKPDPTEARAQQNFYLYSKKIAKNQKNVFDSLVAENKQNNAATQCQLALCYSQGRGVNRDWKQAFEWYRKAAIQGYAPAQYEIANCYHYGRGTAKNPAEANRWYGKSAIQGYLPAQNLLKRELPVGQDFFIEPHIKAFGLRGNNIGMCYGVAIEGAQAALTRELEKFKLRYCLLQNTPVEQIKTLVAAVKEKIKTWSKAARRTALASFAHEMKVDIKPTDDKALDALQKLHVKTLEQQEAFNKQIQAIIDAQIKTLTTEEQIWFEIGVARNTVETVQLLESIQLHDKDSKDEKTTNFTPLKRLQLIQSNKLTALGGAVSVGMTTGIYTQKELSQYFKLLEETFIQNPPLTQPVVLVLKSHNHAITVSYDPSTDEKNKWTLINANHLAGDSRGTITDRVRSAFFCQTGSLALGAQIISVGNQEEKVKQAFAKLQTNPEWQTLHTVTPEKAARKEDVSGINWLWIAAWGETQTVESLIKAGANIQVSTAQDRTPLKVALRKKLPEIAALLIEAHIQEAKTDNPIAKINLGDYYRNGDPLVKHLPKDEKTAFVLYHEAFVLAEFQWNNYSAIDKSIEKVTARKTLAQANRILGDCYSQGIGTGKDEKQAFTYYQNAADHGDAEAQAKLGDCYNCYNSATGIGKDPEKAFSYYQKASQQNCVRAYTELGLCYECGLGTRKDQTRAFGWYQKAANQDDFLGYYHLGHCYLYGVGTAKNESLAFECYQRAATRGLPDKILQEVLNKEVEKIQPPKIAGPKENDNRTQAREKMLAILSAEKNMSRKIALFFLFKRLDNTAQKLLAAAKEKESGKNYQHSLQEKLETKVNAAYQQYVVQANTEEDDPGRVALKTLEVEAEKIRREVEKTDKRHESFFSSLANFLFYKKPAISSLAQKIKAVVPEDIIAEMPRYTAG